MSLLLALTGATPPEPPAPTGGRGGMYVVFDTRDQELEDFVICLSALLPARMNAGNGLVDDGDE